MNKILFICITLLLSCISLEPIFALGCDLKLDLPSQQELIEKTDKCIKERKSGNPNSITDFVCPQGEVFNKNGQVINDQTLRYLTTVNISFNKIEVDILKYMKDLQKMRTANPTIWTNNNWQCSEKIFNIYQTICGF